MPLGRHSQYHASISLVKTNGDKSKPTPMLRVTCETCSTCAKLVAKLARKCAKLVKLIILRKGYVDLLQIL